MADKIIKESYLLAAPFEEDKTSQSEHKPFNNNSKFVPPSLNLDIKESNILDLKYESESPSPTKTPNETLVRFEIKNHEILKKEDYVVSNTSSPTKIHDRIHGSTFAKLSKLERRMHKKGWTY